MRFICNSYYKVFEINEDDPDLASAYKAIGKPTVCNIEIRGNVVLCSELPAGKKPGKFITNNAEHIATKVCQRFQIVMDKLIYIEHYPIEAWFYEVEGKEETFDLVEFDIVSGHFVNPKWRPLTEEEKAQYLPLFEERLT